MMTTEVEPPPLPDPLSRASPSSGLIRMNGVALPTVNPGMPGGEIESRIVQALEKGPGINLRLDVINSCNLRCIMCPFGDESAKRPPVQSLKPDAFSRIFRDLAPLVCKVRLSIAAEPLVSPHFPEILDIVSTAPPFREIGLCTNAMLLDERVSHQLIARGVTTVMLSIDGVSKSTVERIRAGADFGQIIRNIATLRDLKRASGSRYPIMTSNYVLMRSNIQEAPAYVGMAKELGIESIDFRHVAVRPDWPYRGEELNQHRATYNAIYPGILTAAQRHGVHVILPRPFPGEKFSSPKMAMLSSANRSDHDRVLAIQRNCPEKIPSPRNFPPDFPTPSRLLKAFPTVYCHRPFTDIQISHDSAVKPCSWYRKVLGNLQPGAGLRDIFFGKAYAGLRANMFRPEGDPGCEGCLEKAWQATRDNSSSAPVN